MVEAARIEVRVEEPYAGLVPEETLCRVAETAVERERRSGPDRVSVTVTGDEELRDLNRLFRGIDEVTDVLSFGTEGARDGRVPEAADGFVRASGEALSLGDVVISFPQARRQAADARRPVTRELAMLTAHGVLHLLGFDHVAPGEGAVMFRKTDEIVAEVLGPDPSPVIDEADPPAREGD